MCALSVGSGQRPTTIVNTSLASRLTSPFIKHHGLGRLILLPPRSSRRIIYAAQTRLVVARKAGLWTASASPEQKHGLFFPSGHHVVKRSKTSSNSRWLAGSPLPPCLSYAPLRWPHVSRRALSQLQSTSGRADLSTRCALVLSLANVALLVYVDSLQLLTDRFAVEGTDSPLCVTDDREYCGGTYRGIIDKLDYIQDLGFDAIWISPIFANVQGSTAYGEAYHGYWAQDIYEINPHFGSADDLVALSDALHARDMCLMVDVVVNHFGPANSSAAFASFNPLDKSSYFHRRSLITDYNNQTDVEQCWLGDDKLALADVDTENPWIAKTFIRWIESLVEDYSIDGLRIDTVKHVRKHFWPAFAASSGVYTIGEVFHGDTAYMADYTRSCFVNPLPPSVLNRACLQVSLMVFWTIQHGSS